MKHVTILCFIFLSSMFYSQSWNEISFSTENYKRIRQLNDDSLFIGSNESIYKSLDGGSSWTLIFNSGYINDFYFIDENIGYVLYYDNSSLKMAKTVDGGLNWTLKSSENGEVIYFIDELNGISVSSSFIHYHTNDGAETWSQSFSYLPSSQLGDAHFPSYNVGYIAGWYPGGIAKSTDGGNSWSQIYGPSELSDVYFVTPDIGYLVGYFDGVYKTTDGAQNFTAISENSSNFNAQNLAISCVDENNCWIVQSNYSGADNYYSKINHLAGGIIFENQLNENNIALRDISCAANTCYSAGLNGKIFKLVHNLSISDLDNNKKTVIKIYPNPANDLIYLESDTENLSIEKIELYSLEGKILESFEAFPINISKYDKGMYLLVLKSDLFQTKEFKIVKD